MLHPDSPYSIPKQKAYRKTGTWDPNGTVAGPYKNRETRTRDPSEILAGPHKNQKAGTQDPSGTLQKSENGDPGP